MVVVGRAAGGDLHEYLIDSRPMHIDLLQRAGCVAFFDQTPAGVGQVQRAVTACAPHHAVAGVVGELGCHPVHDSGGQAVLRAVNVSCSHRIVSIQQLLRHRKNDLSSYAPFNFGLETTRDYFECHYSPLVFVKQLQKLYYPVIQ